MLSALSCFVGLLLFLGEFVVPTADTRWMPQEAPGADSVPKKAKPEEDVDGAGQGRAIAALEAFGAYSDSDSD